MAVKWAFKGLLRDEKGASFSVSVSQRSDPQICPHHAMPTTILFTFAADYVTTMRPGNGINLASKRLLPWPHHYIQSDSLLWPWIEHQTLLRAVHKSPEASRGGR